VRLLDSHAELEKALREAEAKLEAVDWLGVDGKNAEQ